ncbi:MAG: hypothetical protein H6738_19790 [Alphaproteobacteria bacterium]|nr:hypothetical protein [Alphaproteobacteria bacterium]MCB9699033.1 hypothetical protein [Alphaproteobacteria bacterium]
MRGAWVLVSLWAGCTTSDGTTKTDVATTDTPTEETGQTTTPPDHTGVTTTTTEEGFCAVRQVFNRNCVVCHNAAAPQGDLDLQTDPYAAVVGVTSAAYGVVLVQPNDHAGSLLWRKMEGAQAAGEGDAMPPPNGASATDVQTVQDWIDAGAPETCGTGGTTTPGAYHPKGWDAPDVHGMATKFQTETDCRVCHGSDLSGGSASVSCTSCHGAGWETNCTFCHGGVLSTTGAPPEDIDDNDDPATISFVPHEVHGAGRISPVFDCVVCHDKPTDALTPGHLFDDPTAGEAEVVFNIAPGAYDGTNRCSNLYCHGNGLGNNGAVNAGAGPRTCHSCHPDRTTSGQWGKMSGEHRRHLNEGFECETCHQDAQGSTAIDVPALHVNGNPDVRLPQGMNFNAQTQRCDGTCHGERHNSRHW